MVMFLKNDIISIRMSQAVEILYIGLFFDTESYNAQVKFVTSQNVL